MFISMNKIFHSIIKILSIFIILKIVNVSIIVMFSNYFPGFNVSSNLRPELNYDFLGIILICLRAFGEEFSYRYLLKFRGWIGAGWLVFVPYLVISGTAIYFFKYIPTVLDVWYFNISFLFLSIIYFKKIPVLYKYIFEPSQFKMIFSALVFGLAHLLNYQINSTNFGVLLVYIILLHAPSGYFYHYVMFKFKYGLLWATLLHISNNFLPLLLAGFF